MGLGFSRRVLRAARASAVLRDLCGVAAAALALALRLSLDRILPPPGYQFLTFIPAVILASYLYGTRPGIICAVLSGLAVWYFFIPPYETFSLSWPIAAVLLVYGFVVTVFIGLIHALKRSAEHLRQARHEAVQSYVDLEQRYRTQADALHASAALQSAILTHAGYAVIATNSTGTITLFNPAAERMLGYAADDLVGKADPTVFHERSAFPARAESLAAEFGQAIDPGFDALVARTRHGLPNVDEWTFVKKNGTRLPVRLNISALRDESGTDLGFLCIASDLSDHYTHEAELKAAKAGTWSYAIATGLLSLSAEAARQLGLAEAAVTFAARTRWLTLVHAADVERTGASVRQAIATQGRLETEFRVPLPDGAVRWVTAIGEVEAAADGTPARVVGLILDMTRQKEAEQALHESEQRYRLAAENAAEANRHLRMAEEIAHAGHWRLEFPANRLVWSDEVFRIHGLDPRDPIPSLAAAIEAYHVDDRDQVGRHVEAAIKGGTDFSLGLRLVRPGGEIRYVLSRGLCEKNEAGEVTALFGTIVDMTELRAAEQAALTNEARYRLLAETTTDVIVQLDLDLACTYASPASSHVLGYVPADLLGERGWSLIHPRDLDGLRRTARLLTCGKATGDRAIATFRLRRRDRTWVWIEAGLHLLRDEAKQRPLALICALRDVTTRQLAAQHLEKAKAAAEAAAQVKSEFVANMSHELRTPLTGIMAVHDLLRRDPTLSDEQRRLVDLASGAGHSLLIIVNDVLDFSKIEAGQMSIEAIPFDLTAVLAGCEGLAAEAAKGKPLVVSTRLSDDVPRQLVGDPTRLQQILFNLMGNAVKFTAAGSVTVDVRYRHADGVLRVDVVDTGIGIPADQVDVLFDRFTQADTSTVRRFGGTGLGLAICKRLTALMGGAIGTQPASHGAHLWFELPLRQVARPVAVPYAAAAASDGAEPSWHLLLAEDNALNAEIIATILRQQGYRVTCVGDGAAAVEAVRALPDLDLVLMDLQMPVMDGLAATAAIRARPHGGDPAIPIVGLTANALAEDAERCRAAGMDAHVAKPIVWPTLFETLRAMLARASATRREAPRGDDGSIPVHDRDTLDSLASAIGSNRLGTMLAEFVAFIEDHAATIEHMSDPDLAAHAHRCTSMAGHFGLMRLSGLCSEIENGLRAGRVSDGRAVLRDASLEAVAAIKAYKAA